MPGLKMSVFTPTHRLDYLLDAYESLAAQTYENFEWVLVPNNGGRIPHEITKDPRVRVVPAPPGVNGIGALKRFACEACLGDYFVELDHDDMLREDALQKIADAAADRPGFIYSDNVDFFPNWSCRRCSSDYNWETYETEWRGRRLTALRAFEPTPASLRTLLFAPNHVRVWAREVYHAVGGHNPELPVADDLDLMCRTYLHGAKFVHIPECLYFYRLQDGVNNRTNSWLEMNAELQTRATALTHQYTEQLVLEWTRRNSLIALDVGAGINPAPGYKSADLTNADILCDIGTETLPIADNSVGVIRCHDLLEHIPPCNKNCAKYGTHHGCIVAAMNDFYRVLAPDGWLRIRVPSTDGRGAWQDPSHVSGWNSNSFWYYTRREQAKFIRGLECRYMAQYVANEYPTKWHETHKILYAVADLVALKGQRTPGLDLI